LTCRKVSRSFMGRAQLKNQVLARIFTAFPGLAARWGKGLAVDRGEIPWSVPRKPLRKAVLAMVTTGGVHLRHQPPFDMSDPNGDPSFREIPADTPAELLTITHDYYDHRDADLDPELVMPIGSLRELVARGALGALHPLVYGLMGHIDGPHLDTLRQRTAPEIARRLAAAGVDYALLVPA
jgi:D-proline reductase (dithiol) PrdB